MLAPTLVVGLGGTGADIVQRVSRKVTKEQRDRIGFVVFDTDVNELKEITNQTGYIKTVQTSTKLSVGEYLNIDIHARDNWFPVNKILSRKTLTEGAGQVRAISRLALDTAIRAGNMEPLHKAIEELYKLEGEQTDQALRVIIVSSLAGGTGSGLILPISMYIKNFMATRFQQSSNITRGFFILPEVFYEVIKGQAERNNLKCNAYASLRELDAFLMKGDGTLSEKYRKTLRFEFPRIGSDSCEEYDVMPFDFCFLFDAQNIDGKKLNSFNQYKDHAASCIYAQSIGPMNTRSNSSEDNTIRELCRAGGRNRYAGAGSSMLIYPMEDVKKYISLQWAKQCVSEQWLVFDHQFKKKSIQNNEMRSQGYQVRELDAAQDYIAAVDAFEKQKKPLGSYIVNSCSILDNDGLNRKGDKWTEYITNLRNYISDNYSEGQRELDQQREEAEGGINRLGVEGNNEWESFQTTFYDLQKYMKLVVRSSEEVARTIAYTMFKEENTSITREKHKYQLETYLRTDQGEFIHPNAARYFLYQTLHALKQEKRTADNANTEYNDFFDNFEKNTFSNEKTEGNVATAADLAYRKKTFMQKLTKRLSSDQEEMLQKYKRYLRIVDEYRVNYIYAEILKEAIEYVNHLCHAFQVFFSSFEGSVTGIQREILSLESKYQDIKGDATRYVCASRTCFQKMNARMPFRGNALNLSSELCDKIYMQVRKYAMMKEKPNNDSFFVEIFNQDILGYFSGAVMESFGQEIDMDIIRALEMEAELAHEIFDHSQIQLYVKEALKESKHLSEPFIEKPLGEQKTIITACAYNPCLDQLNNPSRHTLVNQELDNDGGCPDDDISKNMIIFYKSIYGLRANELSKFAPPSKDGIAPREAGEYYKAYFELISQIQPNSQETTVISPHIDREWHLISKLPDLDERNELVQEEMIIRAFVYGMILKKIQYCYVTTKKSWYRLVVSGSSAEDFVVSNKTACDAFYEVLDALIMNPTMVKKIMKSVEYDFEKERLSNKKVSYETCLLKKQLEEFHIDEFSDEVMSVFDIPTILKISTPVSEFREEQGIQVTRIILDLLYEYISKICSADEKDEKYGELILAQFAIYKENTEWYKSQWSDVLLNYFDTILGVVIEKLESMDLEEYAQQIIEFRKQMNKARREKNRTRNVIFMS